MYDKRRDLISIASEVGISFGAVELILTDIFGMSKVSARWVTGMLTDGQKRDQLDISRHLLSRYQDDPAIFSSKLDCLLMRTIASFLRYTCYLSFINGPISRDLLLILVHVQLLSCLFF